jgi:hypothetical protein
MFINDLPYTIQDANVSSQFNYAAINEFYVVALDIPGVTFFVQNFTLPSVSMERPSDYGSPYTDIPLTGTKMKFGELTLKFMVNENLENYKSVFNWISGITFPESNDQFIEQVAKKKSLFVGSKNVEMSLRSDVHVLALDSNKNPTSVIEFKDAFPTSLSDMVWSSTDSSVDYFKATVTMEYTLFKFL